MSAATTSVIINSKLVKHGDKIIDFRGDVFTFDYAAGGRIYVTERPNGFYARVFKDKA